MGKTEDTTQFERSAGRKKHSAIILLLIFSLGMIMSFPAKAQTNTSSYLTSLNLKQVAEAVNVEIEEMPLEKALRMIAKQANVGISFDTDVLPDHRVSARFENKHIVNAIGELLAGTDLVVTIAPSGHSLVITEKEKTDARFQETITGRVTDRETGEPLPGVNIVIRGAGSGTATDADGVFTLQVENLNQVLVFSYIGYQTLERELEGENQLDVSLLPEAILGEDIVVVAYGTVSREEFVGSATQLTSRDFAKRAITSPTQIIAGASPGVRITSGGGQPGSEPNIRIRGIGSVNASNDPLIVLDGVVYTGQLASINPNDIESFTVLKDAASTSLYGSGAANGVIMITTRQGIGSQERSQLTVNMSQGISTRSIPAYERVSAEQYYPLIWEAYRNSLLFSDNDISEAEANLQASNEVFSLLETNPFNVSNDQIVGTDGMLNPNATLLYDDDWWDEIARTGARSDLGLSYGGGNDRTDYYASVGYLNETGYVISSDFERINARLNINSDLTGWFKAGVNLAGTITEGNNQVDGLGSSSFVNPFRGAMFMGPIYPIWERDSQTGAIVEAGRFDAGNNRPQDRGRHVIWENLLNQDIRKNTSVNTRAYGEFNFLENFNFRFTGSFDRRFENREYARNPVIGDGAPGGDASRRIITRTGVNFDQLLTYTQQISAHSFDVLLGHNSFQYEYDYHYSARSSQVAEGNTNLINYVNILDGITYVRDYRKEAYFSRLNYDYDNKYYLNVSVRRDASSRFHKDVRWNNFWSVGASWRINREAFMQDLGWINSLRLRASYGEVGNDSNLSHSSLSYYAHQPLYSLDYNNASEPGILLNTDAPGNPFLQWESNRQTDIAIEFDLFNNRISGTVEWYNRETGDLLFDVPLPISTGFEEFPDNIGTMYNRGVEFTVDAHLIRKNNFQWNLLVNASTLTNRFKSLPQEEIITGTKKLQVGHSIYDYWLRQWYGVDPADGSALYIASEEAIEAGGSDIRTVDGVLVTTNHNNAEYGYTGTAIPDLYGSFTNSLSFKGLTFSTLFTYQIGGKTYDNSNYGTLMHPGSSYGTALHTDILNRWQQPGDVTNVPRLDSSQGTAFGAASSRWLFDSDYLVLQNATLSYDIPPSISGQFGVTNATVYASGENLIQFTAIKGQEAELQFNGTTTRRYAPARVITLGVNVTF